MNNAHPSSNGHNIIMFQYLMNSALSNLLQIENKPSLRNLAL